MRFSCIACGNHHFEADIVDVERAKVISFQCPECGEYTALMERQGGGVIVSRDAWLTKLQSEQSAQKV